MLQVDAVRGLSVLEAYMLVAVVRLQRRGGPGGASFERAFAEYESLQRLHRTADAYGRAAALRAFERLLSAALLERPGGRYGQVHILGVLVWCDLCIGMKL